ncbi:Stk1 family PASTA domain-containing Ser/Thr kinase [Caldalkalibacillus thermarum TA2.A1]|uniref:Serine/threonine-protein kinase PrkC n=1 Tax=Caldalkalibacillus thermarum (strain TA2.A1) TaxID=986075 RepID=A0A8X8I2K8_CALTT|nr:Stk1 family PASTA domain-containing Ser/Thr kinase [Caldalkalibacillus thermarum]QZT32802.1 Stk1 family PASTA domain-containing Ser/Thr kinase [Caldalkalibacillus thermarum TA2.A1]
MIGKKLVGRYELMERVGGGGMAVVYKARDRLLNRIVAVKILREQFSGDHDFVDRFRREAQAAASLSHPNIVNIYDVGIDEGIHFIVMEYIDGLTLKEYIAQKGRLPVEEAIHITRQIAEALEHAHQNNIIHRDIKPHNILIGPHKHIKVTDFGIARAATSSTITHTGSVIGSVHYFSPEQARGGVAGQKSDIYSLGIVLYEMVTGELPFSGDSPISVALKHLQEPFTEPRQLNPNIPQSVENIILRCLAKNPSQRYDSADGLIQDLNTCLSPERLNEPKWTTEQIDDEDEATKVVPAIKDDLFETKVIEKPLQDTGAEHNKEQNGDAEGSTPKQKKKRRIWLKLAVMTLIILLLSFGTYQGVKMYIASQEVEVPDVYNLPVEEATEQLEALKLVVDASAERYHDEVEEGHVLRQNPVPGTVVKKGSTVRLTVSKGKLKIEMPSVVHLTEQQARNVLRNFTVYTMEEHHDEIPEGHVISQDPEAGELVVEGETEVRLVISKGKRTFKMPNLKGMTLDEAKAVAAEYQLVINEVRQGYSADFAEGQIYQQYPYDPGMEVTDGSKIDVWISQGPEIRQKSRQITVALDDDGNDDHPGRGKGKKKQRVKVEILVRDYQGERKAFAEHISKTKTYTVDVVVIPRQSALIQVFLDGELHHEEQVGFND